MKEFNLTPRETDFVNEIFANNGGGHETWTSLLSDNYSWVDDADLRMLFKSKLAAKDRKATLSSLLKKEVLRKDDVTAQSVDANGNLYHITKAYIEYRVSQETSETVNEFQPKVQKIRELLSRELRSSGVDSGMDPIIRQLIFDHCPQSEEFWTDTVPNLIVQWMPELKMELIEILNPTISKWVRS